MVLLDDTVDEGEPQSGALALAFGRKERLEKPRPGFGVHAASGVAHGHHDVSARLNVDATGLFTFFEIDAGCLDHELAAVGHGVA